MSAETVYYTLLGIAAVISALTQRNSNKDLSKVIEDMRAELKNHRERLEKLEAAR